MTKPPNSIVSLMFHDVTDAPEKSGFQQPTAGRYKHSTELFRRYLDVVEQCHVSGPPQPPSHDRSSDQRVIFTFDDGGVAAMQAADLLEERNRRGRFLITTGLIGAKGFVTEQHLRELAGRGHVIGSHSVTHPDVFRQLTSDQKAVEWSQSRLRLEDILGSSVDTASVPGGDMDRETVRQGVLAGIHNLFTSEPVNRSWRHSGGTCYGRQMMLDTTTPETLRRWLTYPRMGPLPELALRKAKTSIKRLISPVYLSIVKKRRALHEAA